MAASDNIRGRMIAKADGIHEDTGTVTLIPLAFVVDPDGNVLLEPDKNKEPLEIQTGNKVVDYFKDAEDE